MNTTDKSKRFCTKLTSHNVTEKDLKEFARYLFYTSTGEEFIEKNISEKTGFTGESGNDEVYMFYESPVKTGTR